MSYTRDPRAPASNPRTPTASSYSYNYSDSDDDYAPPPRQQSMPPPPPPPPARRYDSYEAASRTPQFQAPTSYNSDLDEPFSAPSYPSQARQPQPPPPPLPLSLQPGRRYDSPAPPGYPSSTGGYQPAGGYAHPPPLPAGAAAAYRASPPPNAYRPPPPPGNSNAYPNAYSSTPPQANYRESPPPNTYRGPTPSNGTYRPSPPPSARNLPPPSAYLQSPVPQTPPKSSAHAPAYSKRTASYSEDYSAYGISNATPRLTPGRYQTEDMSGRIANQNAQELQSPPMLDRRRTEELAVSIGNNIQREEATMAAKIGDLVTSGSAKLTAAQGVIDKYAALLIHDTYKLAKDQVEVIMTPAKDVIAMLEVIKNIHPVVGILIKLEVDRRENDKSIAVIHLTMTNLLFLLSYLEPVFDTADKIRMILQKFLEEVCKTMNQFGNFADAYYKQRGLVRMIRSNGYKTKLVDFATSFEAHKKELQYLMTTKTAATVTKMDNNVQDVSAKLDQVLAFINLQNPKEHAIARRIQEYPGGENAAVMDDKFLSKIGKILKEEINGNVKHALREDIDDVLKSNFARFGLKVETAMSEIKNAVERSTETIMTRLDSGPHDLINDQDIKAVWKGMLLRLNWRLSCKCRHFVDAVHHHYAQKFGKFTVETGEPHPERWTLKFLSNIIFLGDAIDEDGSGYLSVHEVNRFFNSRPREWTPPQCLSQALIDSIAEASKTIMPQNKAALKPYLKKECYGKIHLMIEGLYTDNLQYHGEATGSEYEHLGKYRRELMDAELAKMKIHLAGPNYELDSKEAVQAVLGTHRVEVPVLCLLYLVLRRHKKILDFAQKLVLEEYEFDAMVETIDNIVEAFQTRFHNLLECWRQQRLDTKHIACFSGGIFESWHEDDLDSDWESELDSLEDEEFRTEELAAHAHDESDPHKARDILLYGVPPQPTKEETEQLREEQALKKEKKEKKKAKKAVLETDSDDDDAASAYKKKGSRYSDYGGSDYGAKSGAGYESDRPKSSAKKSLYEYDANVDYDDDHLWDSLDEDSDSGNSSDSSASDFVTRKTKKPKLEERITDLEDQLNAMQTTLNQILTLTKKSLGNR
ncbi:hypothetical protein C8J57DRAFT_1293627 [Mycena rebaudengoi]|nr:hypothetical protein C8J57DRAFT_1293627 [Mycena rebaudengoi]